MRRASLTTLVLTVLVGVPVHAEEPAADTIAVVVGRESFIEDVDRDELRELYLRRQRLWSNGRPAMPVNLPAGNELRESFSRRVLGRSVRDLVSYWNARYFEGIRPPIVLPSAAAVCAYVGVEPGAIGYLPSSEIGDGCRVVLRLPK